MEDIFKTYSIYFNNTIDFDSIINYNNALFLDTPYIDIGYSDNVLTFDNELKRNNYIMELEKVNITDIHI